MKNFPSLSSLIVILLTAFLLQNCTKKDETPITPPPGEISIGEFTMTPDGIFVNEAAELLVRLVVPANVTLVDSSAKLVRVDNDNKPIAEIGLLFDNGKLENGDEIIGDNVFSGIFSFTSSTVGEVRLRVDAQYREGDQTGDGSTTVKILRILSDLTAQEFNEVANTQKEAADKLGEFIGGNVNNVEAAVGQLAQWFATQPEVQTVEYSSETSISILYKSGLYGGMVISVEDQDGSVATRGGVPQMDERKSGKSIPLNRQTVGKTDPPPARANWFKKVSDLDPKIIGNRSVFIYAPYEAAFAPHNERVKIQNILNSSDFQFEIDTYINQAATVSALFNMTNYGYVILATHGSGGKSFLTGEIVDTTSEIYQSTYKKLYKENKIYYATNVVIAKNGTEKTRANVYGVRASLISSLAGKFPNSVILNNSCESTKNADLENAFTGKGAKTYYGYSKIVSSKFCVEMADTLTRRLAKELKTTGESFLAGSDPYSTHNATYQMKGANDVRYPDDLINGDFEFGKLDGWTKSGDGRVISKLAFINPPGGNYMGIISTGLGFTTATGSIFQTFTVKNTESTLTVKWNFLSEEFLEYIGSQFQDYFRIIIKTPEGQEIVLLNKTIDGIAADFGASYDGTTDPPTAIPGNLISVSPGIVFDRGGVYMTDWQTSTFDVTAYRGKRITLILAAGDVGDSIYDTAILLDDISIK